ncbi:MAG: aspartate aminotransferase family protein [Dysgonamonadaceae bacterium]|jgi:acetylornithine aminotransferase|nr:aspartate aminotransferase family protein [Dysgonamonadaceae bacterium]
MELFKIYPTWDIDLVKGRGCRLFDDKGVEYLDFYGGHAVISIGHAHPYYVEKITAQLKEIGFYSNFICNHLQKELAEKLGKISGYADYALFLINSGAEANENAMKLASFHNGRKKIVAFKSAFHGRTSLAVAATDIAKYRARVNEGSEVEFFPLNDIDAVVKALSKQDVAAVIIEGIQGVGGIRIPTPDFLQALSRACRNTGTVLILDEIQSGYGRSGRFFAHQHADIRPDLITVAKGMGNGFPIAGLLISPEFEAVFGQLGTTFGGNHLACAAAIAVVDVMNDERLVDNAAQVGSFLISELRKFPQIKEVRGHGLMIGLEFEQPIGEKRTRLLFEEKVFTGMSGTNIFRLLPPLCVTMEEADAFLHRFSKIVNL